VILAETQRNHTLSIYLSLLALGPTNLSSVIGSGIEFELGELNTVTCHGSGALLVAMNAIHATRPTFGQSAKFAEPRTRF
jgi:hypothetical protein